MSGAEKYIVAVGPVCIDEYYTANGWVPEGSKLMMQAVNHTVGGMIPNAACVFAGYGVKTYFYDVMNTGAVAQRLLEDLRGYGLDCSPVVFDDSVPDAKCIIVLTPGDRTILVVDSRKPQIELTGERLELFRGAAYLYTTVFEFSKFKNAVVLADDLKAHGVQLVFDIESTTFDAVNEELFQRGDVLFFNQYGFEKYCAGADPETVYSKLFAYGAKIITVTLGKHGSYTRTPTDQVKAGAIDLPVVDPTGAGDTFNSSFVRCILEGMDIHAAAQFANAAASYSVTQMGPKGGVGSADRVTALLRQYKD